MQPLSQWLQSAGLAHLEGVLVANGIAEDVLTSLTDADLVELGLSMGDRKRLRRAIDALGTATPGAPAEVAPVAPAHEGPASARAPLSAERPLPDGAPSVRPDAGEMRQLTILFCDLVGSVALCSRLTPDAWREVVLAYQEAAVTVVERLEGTVAQYLGDGLLVYFGFPKAHEDAAERAVRAAMAMVDAVRELHLEPLAALGTRLMVRIGIHTGQVVIGDVGRGTKREHLALGDAPNVAARLQALAAPDTVVVSETTRRMCGGAIAFADLGEHHLKGTAAARRLWRVDSVVHRASRFEAATGATLSPLVGRERELAVLAERWERAREGHGQTVLLAGDAGVGKSRMLRELSERVGTAGLHAMKLQCSAHDVHVAFHPSVEALTRTLRLTRDQLVSTKLDRLEATLIGEYQMTPRDVAVLASMLSVPCADRYGALVGSAHEREKETIAVLVEMIRARARRAPTLVLLEDAQWADPATLGLIDALIERTRDVPLLLIITHRPEPGLAERLSAHPHVTALGVPALGHEEVADLVWRLAGGRVISEELARQIVSRTDGVPLFVEELTRWILDSSTGGAIDVPTTLRDSLMARLDRDPRAKAAAQLGAVFGRDFRRDWVEAIADERGPELEQSLRALTEAGLAQEHAEQVGVVYTFKHGLVQDVAYDSMVKARREVLHGRVVALLQELPATAGVEPALVARHASLAGQPGVAIPYRRRASELAMARLALHEAIAHLTSGIADCALLPASTERDVIELQLQASLGTVQMLRSGWAAEEVARAFARANELGAAVDSVEEAIWPLWGVCVFHLVHGEVARAVAIGRRMMTVARQSGSRNAWLVTNMIHVQLMMYSGRFSEVAEHVDQVEHRYADPQDRALIALYTTDLKLVTMVHASQTRLFTGVEELADERCAEEARLAASLDHPYSLAWTLTWGAMSFLHRGRAAEVLERVEEGLRLAAKHDYPYVAAMATFQKGWAFTRLGRGEEGVALMEQGIAAFRATGAGIAVPFFLVLLAEALGESGRKAEGLRWLDEAERLVEAGGERWHEAELHRVRGGLLAAGPDADVERAAASLGRAVDIATSQRAYGWRARAARDLAALRS